MQYVYVLYIDYASRGDRDTYIKVFSDLEKARQDLRKYIEADQDWADSLCNKGENIDLESDWYEVYEDDDYIAEHSLAYIEKKQVL